MRWVQREWRLYILNCQASIQKHLPASLNTCRFFGKLWHLHFFIVLQIICVACGTHMYVSLCGGLIFPHALCVVVAVSQVLRKTHTYICTYAQGTPHAHMCMKLHHILTYKFYKINWWREKNKIMFVVYLFLLFYFLL